MWPYGCDAIPHHTRAEQPTVSLCLCAVVIKRSPEAVRGWRDGQHIDCQSVRNRSVRASSKTQVDDLQLNKIHKKM